MANIILKKIKTPDLKIVKHAGLDSVSIDLTSIQQIIQILLKKTDIKDLLKDKDGLTVNDALFTTLFIKYRRCFNSTGRNASLSKKHIPKEYVELHEYILCKATEWYAHVFDFQVECHMSIDEDKNELRGLNSTHTSVLFPLNKEALALLDELLNYLQKFIREKQKKIKAASNKALQGTS